MRTLLTTVVAALTASAGADPINPGFDYFTSNDADGNSLGSAVDLSDFGFGVIPLKGVPFDIHGAAADAFGIDTVVIRRQGLDPFDWPDDSGIVDIELVALHLVSVEPIDLGGGNFADLHTIVNHNGRVGGLPEPQGAERSRGKMEIRHEIEAGGTFDSLFGSPGDDIPIELIDLARPGGGVNAFAYLTIPGSDVNDQNNWIVQPFAANRLTLWSEDSTWEHTQYTDFQVTGIEHFCPFPECHPVDPVFNVPGAPTIALLPMVCLGRRRR